MSPSFKIRRSGAYGIAGAAVLVAWMFLPMSTPRWFMNVTWCLIAALAGAAVFFSSRERKAGQSGRSVGFFILAVLFIVLAFFAALVFVL
jgi:uncharacterized membrane protein SirB2